MDSFPTVFIVYKKMCAAVGIKLGSDINRFRELYGYNYWAAYRNLGIGHGDHKKVGAIFRREIIKQNPKLFKGIDKVIKKLSEDYQLILATSNLKAEAIRKLKHFKLLGYFSHVIGDESKGKYSRTKALVALMEKLKIDKAEVVFIADRNVDYDKLKAAGFKKILLVEYGWGYDKSKVKRQKVIIKKPADLTKALHGFSHT